MKSSVYGSVRIGAVLACMFLTCAAVATPANAAYPGKNGKIAFGSDRDGNGDIYTMNADGSDVVRIIDLPEPVRGPRWSPDGKRIAFEIFRGVGNTDVAVADADGTDITVVAASPQGDGGPTWSPDGQRIAFSSNRFDPFGSRIMVMNDDGTDPAFLTSSGIDQTPAWSSADLIAFDAQRGTTRHIRTVRPDGSGEARLTPPSPSAYFEPDWSPDATQLAVVRHGTDGEGIALVPATGGAGTRITGAGQFPGGQGDFEPAWAPDGTRILFERGSREDIWAMKRDGSQRVPLTSGPASDYDPDWQPVPPPVRSDFKNAAHFCKAERDYFGEAEFADRHGGGANAHGMCVSSNN